MTICVKSLTYPPYRNYDKFPIYFVSIGKFELEATFTYNIDKKEGMGTEMYGVLEFENPYESEQDNLVSMLIKGKI